MSLLILKRLIFRVGWPLLTAMGLIAREADIESVVEHINDEHLERMVEGWLYCD